MALWAVLNINLAWAMLIHIDAVEKDILACHTPDALSAFRE